MNKEFLPYELALELKELGFDEDCLSHSVSTTDASGTRWTSVLKAPLYQQAFRWFREKHHLNYTITILDGLYNTLVFSSAEYHCGIYKTYEEAELVCLKKLIEIVKNK
jgi:hypothetical protein